ncbi:Smr/MutS family protein [bacterium]|nr:Smr/MutS family protein [bacterium]
MAKKRIPKMDSDKSMYELFTGEKESKTAESKESFADLLAEEPFTPPPEKESGSNKRTKNIGEVLKNYPAPQKTLDLHGMTQEQAVQQIGWFIQNGRTSRLMTLKIIAGKGLHSRGGKAVLPDLLEHELRLLKQGESVLAFRWDKGNKKSGIIIVYLTDGVIS